MGISGLLNALKSVTYTAHLEQYTGLTAAVDTFCWLHRGTYACSTELCINGDSDKYVKFCLSRIELLQYYNIKPLMVFDGGYLPMKSGKEDEREEKRRKNLAKGMELYSQGNQSAAAQYFGKAIDVTFPMAFKLISALKARNIEYVVAPYEADAQLAYLSRNGMCDFVISEDSDCIPFGCKMVMFKLDKNGSGEVIDARKLPANQDLSLSRFTQEMFLDMCILSGCDYLPSIPGMGLKTAHRFVAKFKKTERILRGIRFKGSFKVPANYEEQFQQARLTFLHQRVYCPKDKDLKTLTPMPAKFGDPDSIDFIGKPISRDLAKAIAEGKLDPFTMQPPLLPSSAQSSETKSTPPLDVPTSVTNESTAESNSDSFQRNSPWMVKSSTSSTSHNSSLSTFEGVRDKSTRPATFRKRIEQTRTLQRYFAHNATQVAPSTAKQFQAPRALQASTRVSPVYRSLKKPVTSLIYQPSDAQEDSTKVPSPKKKFSRHFGGLDVHKSGQTSSQSSLSATVCRKAIFSQARDVSPQIRDATVMNTDTVQVSAPFPTNNATQGNMDGCNRQGSCSDEENFSVSNLASHSKPRKRKLDVDQIEIIDSSESQISISPKNVREPLQSVNAISNLNAQSTSSGQFGTFAKYAFAPASGGTQKPEQTKLVNHTIMKKMFYQAASSP